MANRRSEEQEQIAVVQWCDFKNIPVVHIPNEGKRSVAYGSRLKRMGMRSGFPDLFIPLVRCGFHGFFIEMKVGYNKPTENQKRWLTALTKEGYACTVCYSADDAIKMIDAYINKLGG